MVLSDRFSADPNPSLFKRTALYVLGFGLGALAIAVVVSFTLVSIAEGVLPDSGADREAEAGTEAGTEVNVIGDAPPAPPKAGVPPFLDGASKGRRGRGNEAPKPDAADDPI
jgi:hypothetical protein